MKQYYLRQRLFTILFFTSLFAYGQYTDTTIVSLQQVDVTNLLKASVNKSKLARSLSVISEQDIGHQNTATLSQLLSQQAGIMVNGANNNQGEVKSILQRGAGSSYTMMLVDGIPILDPLGQAFDIRLFSANQFSKIEIMKGGNGVLYGSSAVAGVINLVSHKYEKYQFNTQAEVSYGSYNTLNANLSVGGKLGKIGYHINYDGVSTDGFSGALSRTDALSSLEKDGSSRNALHVKLRIPLLKSLVLEPFVRYANMQYDYDAGAYLDNKIPNANRENLQAGLRLKAQWRSTKLNVLYSLNSVDNQDEGTFGEYVSKGISHYLDGFVIQDISSQFRWVGGIQAQQNVLTSDENNKKQLSFNPYFNGFLNINNKLYGELGLRLVYDELYEWEYMYNVALAYQIASPLRAKVSYSRSYLSPSLSQLYGAFGGNVNLNPEVSMSLDLGLESFILDSTLQISVMGFLRNINNVIIYQNSLFQNYSHQQDYGFDLSLQYQANQDNKFAIWYSFVEGFIEQDEMKTYNLIRRPRHSVGIDGTIKIVPNLFGHLGVYHYGDRIDYEFTLVGKNTVQLTPYTLVNVDFTSYWLEKRLEAYLGFRNLTDQFFMEAVGYATRGFNVTLGVKFILFM